MSFVRYRIGQQEQFIQFDQYFSQHKNKFRNSVFKTASKFEEGQPQKEPLVSISILPPKNPNEWDQKYVFFGLREIIFYSKRINNKIYVYLHFFTDCGYSMNFLNNTNLIIIKIVLLNMLLQNKNLIYLHAMLLNNGDVICAHSMGGKTTLAARINNHNKVLKVITDDGIIVDTKNQIVYPLPFIWEDTSYRVVDITKSLKINKIFILEKDQTQKIDVIDKEQWLKRIEGIIFSSFYKYPFHKRQVSEVYFKWVEFRTQLLSEVIQDNSERVRILSNFEPLIITTNTADINKKYEILEDKI